MKELLEITKCKYCKESLTSENIFGVDPKWNNKIFLCKKCKKMSHEECQDFLINLDDDTEIIITGIPDSKLNTSKKETIEEAPKKRTRKTTKKATEAVPEEAPKKRTRKTTKKATEAVPEEAPKKRTRKTTK